MGQFRHHHSEKTSTPALSGCLRLSRSTLHVTLLGESFFAHAKFQHCEHSSYFVIHQKVDPRFNCRGQYIWCPQGAYMVPIQVFSDSSDNWVCKKLLYHCYFCIAF